MRVLSYTTLYPGPEQPLHGLFVKHRLDRLSEKYEVQVVAPVDILRTPRHVVNRGRAGSGVLHPWCALPPRWGKHRDGDWLFRQTWPQIRRALRLDRYDVLDLHYAYPDGFAGGRVARALNKPYVLSVRGSDLNVLARCPRRRPLIAQTVCGAAAVIAVSSALGRAAVSLGADPARVHVIPNGVDRAMFYPVDRPEARRRLGWDPRGYAVVSVGRLAPVKGFDVLIAAMEVLLARGLDVRAYIVGQGEERGALARTIASRGLGGRVVLCGPMAQADLRWCYGAADLFALMSRSEGCPNVVLEALACGTPVVGTRVGGVPDLMADGRHGALVAPGDADDAAHAMAGALNTRWDRDALAAGVASNEWSAVARRHGEVLQRAAEAA